MDKLIEAFTENIKTGLRIAEEVVFQKPNHEIKNVVICGMGGSGIGGKLVSQWIAGEIPVPVSLSSDYRLPNFVDQHTLVIASSYSGNTEETLAAVEIALQKNAHIIGISSGGNLQKFCQTNSFDCVIVPGGNQPRAALGYSLIQLLNIFSGLKLISDKWKNEITIACQNLDNDLSENKAKGEEIAKLLFGKIPVIYSETSYEAVGTRARQQFNENSKVLGWSLAIPEMNHNELVGWAGGSNQLAVIFLYTEDMNSRNKKRMDLTREIVSGRTDSVYTLHAKGNSPIQRSLYFINVLDWASFYLHQLNKVDVFDIKVINHLKEELSKI